MKISHLIILFITTCSLSLTSCNDDVSEFISKEKLSGFIQKGPFLNGTSISVFELNNDFSQTGKVFNSQIKDNQGTFELTNLQLSSPYVEIKANGFYFNEISGAVSNSQITLYALADITNINSLNVNVVSTLEKSRVEVDEYQREKLNVLKNHEKKCRGLRMPTTKKQRFDDIKIRESVIDTKGKK